MNYEEELKRIEAEKENKLSESNNQFNELIDQSKQLYENKDNQLDQWKTIQDDLINKQVGFSQDQYKRSQAEVEEGYQKEALASNVDYQKFINPYGAEQEQLRKSGLSNAGYSETTKLGAYNTSQQRTAVARATKEKVWADFEVKMQEARLKGDTQLAEIALQQMQMKMDNAMKKFDYYSSTKQNQLQYGQNLDNNYYGRFQDVLTKQQQEQAQQEAIRQFNEQMTYKQQQDKISQDNWLKEYNYRVKQDGIANAQKWASLNANKGGTGGSGGVGFTDNANNTRLSTNYSPVLSSQASMSWANQNIITPSVKNNGITKDELNATLTKGLQDGLINKTDVQRIAKAFGLV